MRMLQQLPERPESWNMKSCQRIFLVAYASMRHTPAFAQAVSLARTSGPAPHIALFDRLRCKLLAVKH
jgi:hypothetical protein